MHKNFINIINMFDLMSIHFISMASWLTSEKSVSTIRVQILDGTVSTYLARNFPAFVWRFLIKLIT